jgi:hypothetical protein
MAADEPSPQDREIHGASLGHPASSSRGRADRAFQVSADPATNDTRLKVLGWSRGLAMSPLNTCGSRRCGNP